MQRFDITKRNLFFFFEQRRRSRRVAKEERGSRAAAAHRAVTLTAEKRFSSLYIVRNGTVHTVLTTIVIHYTEVHI
jgi:hypothetical protein